MAGLFGMSSSNSINDQLLYGRQSGGVNTNTIQNDRQLITDGFYTIKGGQFDKFCNSQNANNNMQCNVNTATDSEKFKITHIGNNNYHIQSPTNMYCNDMNSILRCSTDSTYSASFLITDAGNGYYYIIGGMYDFGGTYDFFCSDEANYVICNRTNPHQAAKFQIVPTTAPAPTTPAPTTPAPTTPAPTTSAPITPAPTTYTPITYAPITSAPTTSAPTTSEPLNCRTYDVSNPATLYDTLNDTDPSMYGFMLDCLHKKITDQNRPLYELITSQESDKKDAITASEMNRGMRAIYQSDLFFTISKVFMFIILIGAYIYFLKYTGIIQPIKDGAKIVKDNLDKVKDIKMPKIKMPEITMPSIKMPK